MFLIPLFPLFFTYLMRAGVMGWPSAFSADSSSARPPQAQGDAMLVPAAQMQGVEEQEQEQD